SSGWRAWKRNCPPCSGTGAWICGRRTTSAAIFATRSSGVPSSSMLPEDAIRVRHMIEAAEAAGTFIAGRQRADLESDRMLLFALVRAIEIIGEAASRLSTEGRATMPSVPWASVVAMRHRLVHAYFDIDREIVWKTATEEIPPLLTLLRAA